jgi:hypothetical protein
VTPQQSKGLADWQPAAKLLVSPDGVIRAGTSSDVLGNSPLELASDDLLVPSRNPISRLAMAYSAGCKHALENLRQAKPCSLGED